MYKEDQRLKTYIDTAVKKDMLSQAYIFEGAREAGEMELALYTAQKLLCTCDDPEKTPCGSCHACRLLESGSHPDHIIISHEKPTLISVDEIREGVVDTMQIRPYYGGRKIYVIPDAELMNAGAQNALLKTIEEPPAYALIILIAKDRELLLPTIRSRCVCLSFMAEPVYEPEDEAVAAQFERIKSLVSGESSEDTAQIMGLAKELSSSYKEYLPEVFAYIERICRDALMAKTAVYLTEDTTTRYIDETAGIPYENLEHILKAVKSAKSDILINVAPEAVMDSLFMHIIQNTKKGNI